MKKWSGQRLAIKYKNIYIGKSLVFLLLVLGLGFLGPVACSSDDDEQKPAALKVAFNCEVSGSDSLQVTCTNLSKLGDSAEGLTYAWDFGVSGATSTDKDPMHTYAEAGNYTITLTVTSADGMVVMGIQKIVVGSGGGTPDPTLMVSFNCVPTGLMITCRNSSALGGSTQGLTYAWDFGVPGDTTDTSTDRAPTYTYTRAGSYTITLTVTSPDGMSMMMATMRVTVVPGSAPNPNIAKLTGSTDDSDSSKKWILARADVALGIWPNGPNHPDPDNITSGAGAWWAFGTATPLHDRPCVLDDEYTFSIAGGVMKFAVDTMGTFFRDSDANGGHQAGGAEECVSETDTDIWNITRTAEAGETFPDSDADSTPDIRDYRNKFSESDQGGYTFSLTGDDLTINGEGSYIGLVSKSNTGNGGYLVPDMRTFRILSFTEATDATSPDELIISMAANNGDGGYWVFRLLHYESGMLPAIPMPPPPLVLPVDFEAGTTVSFTGFSGGSGATVANPDATGNTSAMVAKITDDGSDTNAGAFFDLATPADFSTNCGLKMQVYGRAGLPVTLKIEGTGAPTQQLDQNVVADDTWETLSFDFSSVVTTADAMKYNRLVFFLDDDADAAEELHIDNIAIDTDVGTCTMPLVLPVGFEADTTTVSFDGFSGGSGATVENPDATGNNTSAMVAKITDAGGDTNAGAFFDLATPADFSTNCGLKMQVYGRAGLPVTLKIEGTGAPPQQLDQNVVAANTWETLSFDFSSVVTTTDAMKYNRLVFFLDDDADAAEELYIDNIAIDTDVGTCVMPLVLPVGFEAGITVSFDGFDGGSGATVENPNMTGNTSAMVAKITDAGGNNNAGAFFDLATPADFSTNCGLKMQVYGRAGLPVTLKIEGTGAPAQLLDQNVVAANTWETLSFDFSSVVTTADAMKYNRLIFFLDDDADAAEELHIDDIAIDTDVGACVAGSASLAGLTGSADGMADGSKKWILARADVALGIWPNGPNHPNPDDIRTGAGAWWAFGAATPLHERPCILDDEYTFSIAGGVMKFAVDTMGTFFRDSDANGGHQAGGAEECVSETDTDIWNITRMAGEGETFPDSDADSTPDIRDYRNKFSESDQGGYTFGLTGDDLTINGAGSYIGLVSKSNTGDVGYLVPTMRSFKILRLTDTDASSPDELIISMPINNGDNGYWVFRLLHYESGTLPEIPMPPPPLVLPVGFEAGTTVSFTGFSGGSGATVANPDATGNNTSAMVAKITDAGGDNNAGTFFDLATPADFSTNCGLKMQVYGRAGLPVTLKIEGGGGAPPQQLDQNVVAADTWETLSFDFSSVVTTADAMKYNRLVFFLDDDADAAEELHVDDIEIDTSVGACSGS